MTEVKTLKDIEKECIDATEPGWSKAEIFERTRQEAIKHVKEWQSDERLSYPTATIDINAPLALIQLELETKIRTFKHFFNITEEDLK